LAFGEIPQMQGDHVFGGAEKGEHDVRQLTEIDRVNIACGRSMEKTGGLPNPKVFSDARDLLLTGKYFLAELYTL
jgi:hypothetical protein